MSRHTFTIACTLSDRTRPLFDGRVSVNGCDLVCIPGEPEDIFRRALRDRAFEISELSMASHITTVARGDSAYIGVPVFLSRAFRHSSIFVRTDRGISGAADLAGKRVGLPEYQQTAAMWVRGILHDQHDTPATAIQWVVGSQEQPGGTERTKVQIPDSIRIERIGPEDTLNEMLRTGKIDAIITPRPPSCFLEGDPNVARLYPKFWEVEKAYFAETGFFPIMHCLAVRRDVAEATPWLPLELFRAFSRAKAISQAEMPLGNFLRVSLPWIAVHVRETEAAFGGNPWPYGFARNRAEVAAMIRYAGLDGLISRAMEPEELFHPSTLDALDAA